MDIECILPFFCAPDDVRFSQPMSSAAYTYAADGEIAVRVFRFGNYDGLKNPFDLHKNYPWEKKQLDSQFVSLPSYSKKSLQRCQPCRGTGLVRTCPACGGRKKALLSDGYSEYENDCITCSATGVVPSRDDMHYDCLGGGMDFEKVFFGFEGALIKLRYLELIRMLPGAELSKDFEKGEAITFRFKGGTGFVLSSE